MRYPVFDLRTWSNREAELGNFEPKVVPLLTVNRPWGYAIPEEQTDLIALLERHRIHVTRLAKAAAVDAERYLIEGITEVTVEDKDANDITVEVLREKIELVGRDRDRPASAAGGQSPAAPARAAVAVGALWRAWRAPSRPRITPRGRYGLSSGENSRTAGCGGRKLAVKAGGPMKNSEINTTEKRQPSVAQSVTPLVAMGVFLGVGYGVLRLPAEVLLIAAAAVAGVIAHRLGYTYKEIENGILVSMMKGMPAMLIVIVVGALIGSWIACGTIPMLIFYGLKLISPALLPGHRLRGVLCRVGGDRDLLRHGGDPRCGTDRYRPGSGYPAGTGRRGHRRRRLLRRQTVTVLRHHEPRAGGGALQPLRPHPPHPVDHDSRLAHRSGGLPRARPDVVEDRCGLARRHDLDHDRDQRPTSAFTGCCWRRLRSRSTQLFAGTP